MKKLFYSLSLILLFSGSAWAQLSGERTVPSENYPDLQSVADSLNLYGVGSGGVSFMLQGGSTFQEWPLEFTSSGNADDPIYIGWDGVGGKPVVNFEGTEIPEDAGFTLIGVNYYTIDGIKITNSNSNLEVGILITNLNDEIGSSHNTVKNVEIILDKSNANQTVGINVDAHVEPTVLEGSNNHNKFYNNNISNVMIGYNFDGYTRYTELMSVGNEIGTQDGGESIIHNLVLAGLVTDDQNGFVFSNTIIRDLTQESSSTPAAISTNDSNPYDPLTNEFIISNNTLENLTSSGSSIFGMYLSARKLTYTISGNKINNVTATGGGNNTADGILVIGTGSIANIYNNMVSGIAAPGTVINNNVGTRGIQVRTADQANIFYNTVVLDYVASNPGNRSAAFSIYNNSIPVQMRNNIFINKSVLPEDAVDGMVSAVYKRNNNLAGIMEGTDNNIYYAGEPGPQHTIFYGHNNSSPLALETLADYKIAAASFDQNSYTEDVEFIASDDLHIVASATTLARNNAVSVTDPIVITTDFDGSMRDTETPDIGADEIGSALPTLAIIPTPENGATDVSPGLTELSWEYITSPEYTLPEAFLVYFSESSDFDGATPIATVIWDEGQTNYTAPIEDLSVQTEYFWKVEPITALENGETAEDVVVWSFMTGGMLYPNPAENPSPEDGGFVDQNDDHVITLGWDYNPSPDHSLPTHFEVYGASDVTSVAWDTPITEVNYVEGQVAYEIELIDNPNFAYDWTSPNSWKIVPVAANDVAAPDVPVWTFIYDNTIGLNDVSLEEGTVIYPNPAVDFVNIQPGFDGKYEVVLYDVQGRLVKHFGEAEGKRSINIASVQSGAYQLVIRQGDARYTSLIKVN